MSEKLIINFMLLSIIVFCVTSIYYYYFKSIECLSFNMFMFGVVTSNMIWGVMTVDE